MVMKVRPVASTKGSLKPRKSGQQMRSAHSESSLAFSSGVYVAFALKLSIHGLGVGSGWPSGSGVRLYLLATSQPHSASASSRCCFKKRPSMPCKKSADELMACCCGAAICATGTAAAAGATVLSMPIAGAAQVARARAHSAADPWQRY